MIACTAIVSAAIAAWQFTARVTALRELRATGPAWSFPSRLYTTGIPLVVGASLPAGYLQRELEARGYARVSGAPGAGAYAVTPRGMDIGLRGFREAPDPAGAGGPERVRMRLAGSTVASVERLGGLSSLAPPDLGHPPRIEPMLFSVLVDSARVRRTWVPLERIPRVVREAVIAGEDRRFLRHMGLDLRANARALFINVRSGGVRQGGSTLTQQLARGLFVGRERTLPRKLAEASLAVGLELTLSKQQILEMYLNSVYWGQDGADGIAGIAEAARHYFGLPVDSLGLAQAALLAGIIPAPNALSPLRSPRLALRARNRVLRNMVEAGLLASDVAARLARAPLRVRHAPPPRERFPSFAGLVRDEISDRVAAGAAEHRGYAIFTTLDPVWQQDAEAMLASGVEAMDGPLRANREPLQAAFVALDPRTGAVRAIVGGRDASSGDFNRATQARRQPGSAIKPVVYAAALDPARGAPRFTPASTVPDLRREFATPEGPWKPRNDQDDYHETATLAKALAKSLNVATANLVQAIGPATVVRYAERFGMPGLRPVASIGLGSNEVTLLSLTSAYTVFANGGQRATPSSLASIVDVNGQERTPRRTELARVIPPETSALMTGLLEDVVIFGVAYPLRKTYGFVRPVAGKTGTTNDYRDAWFVGYTPEIAAGVWVGFDRPRPLTGPAAEIAIPVWNGIVSRQLQGFPIREFGSDHTLALAWIDPYTGGLARVDCPTKMRVPFLPGTAPRSMCARDHTADWEKLRAEAAAESLAADSLRGADSLATPEPVEAH